MTNSPRVKQMNFVHAALEDCGNEPAFHAGTVPIVLRVHSTWLTLKTANALFQAAIAS